MVRNQHFEKLTLSYWSTSFWLVHSESIQFLLNTFGSNCHHLSSPVFRHFVPFIFLQFFSNSIKLGGRRLCSIFRSFQRCSIEFKSGLCLDHSRTFTEWFWSCSFEILAMCFEALSSWTMNASFHPECLCTSLHSSFSLFWWACLSLPLQQYPCGMMGMGMVRWWAMSGFLLPFTPKSSIFVSHNLRVLALSFGKLLISDHFVKEWL